jgi:hypothetical protein
MHPPEYTLSVTGNLGKGFVTTENMLMPKEATVFLRDHKGAKGARKPDTTIVLEVISGGLVTLSVTFSATSLTRQVKKGDLDALDLERIKREAFSSLVLEHDKATDLVTYPTERKRGRKTVNELAASANATGESEFVAVGTVFCDPKNRANRSQAVRSQLGYGSIATANRRIKEARDKGWIPPVGSTEEEYTERFRSLTPEFEQLQGHDSDAN